MNVPAGLVHRWRVALSDPEEPDWQRPGPDRTQRRADLVLALVALVVSLLALACSESFMGTSENVPRVWGYVITGLIAVPLAVRRAFPVSAIVAATAVFVTAYYVVPHVSVLFTFQLAYFACLYSLVAWTRSRDVTSLVVAGLAVFVVGWLVVDFTLSNAYASVTSGEFSGQGPFDPVLGVTAYSALVNVLFFGAAVFTGRASWRQALARRRLRDQAERIAEQSDALTQRAVGEERLRIARELHDVVAHHVSAIGVQAGAARTVLPTDPDAAARALETVEDSSRTAVGEMRELLGVLRSTPQQPGDDDAARRPEPRLGQLDELIASFARAGLRVSFATALEEPGDLDTLPDAHQMTVYRCVQEALANVVAHSSAHSAAVVLRSGRDRRGEGWVELEVTDRGMPLTGTAGSGYGLRGISERARLYGGTVELGARDPGPGWRVRLRIPRPISNASEVSA